MWVLLVFALHTQITFSVPGYSSVSDAPRPLGSFAGSGRRLRRPVPRHQFIDALLWPSVHEAYQQVGEIDLRIDVVELAGLDERSQASPVCPAFIAAREQAVLS